MIDPEPPLDPPTEYECPCCDNGIGDEGEECETCDGTGFVDRETYLDIVGEMRDDEKADDAQERDE